MGKLKFKNDVKIAYILKNFPKLSETFIAGEIYRLEQLGTDLKLFVIKPPTEDLRHGVVEKIQAERFHLPATTSLSETNFLYWLRQHLGDFSPAVRRVARRHPLRLLRAAWLAFAQSVRARRSFFSLPRKVYFKEFLQAAAIAAEISHDKSISHLHAHFAHGATTVAWLAAIMMNLKFSFTAHAKDIYLESLNPAGLLGRKMDAAEFVVTCTGANKIHLEKVSQTPVHCFYHGLNVDFTALLDSPAPFALTPAKQLRALAVGRLVPKKGFDIFVRACALLTKRGIDISARIIGEGGEHEAEIRRLIEVNCLQGKIKVTGAMTQTELFAEYQRADMFCLPCRITENGDRDGIPNVMMEAMACGLPVVTTNISGIPEIITSGENGWLVPTENTELMAEAMLQIYRNKSLAQKLGAASRKTVAEKFDGDSSAEKLAALFEEALNHNFQKTENITHAKSGNAKALSAAAEPTR